MSPFDLDAQILVLVLATGLAAMGLALMCTPLVSAVSRRLGILDAPNSGRKKHASATPLLGGVAVITAVAVTTAVLSGLGLFAVPGMHRMLVGALCGSALLVIGGYLDDRFGLTPFQQIWFPIGAAVVAVASGIHMPYVRSPFSGEILPLDAVRLALPWGAFHWPADPLTFLWLMALMYTTKIFDGVDGLVTGLTVIGGVLMVAVSLRPEVGQPATALLAAAVAGGFAGFLPWNWSPAKVFLGESGSVFAGYAMGILAVISGSKIATALLIFGIPLLDVVWVIAQRVLLAHTSVAHGDRRHLYYRLIDAGMSVRKAVLFFYVIALAFGTLGLVGSTQAKAVGFVVLMCVMAAVVIVLLRMLKKKHLPV